jgi:hypothetical protein
LITDDVEGVVPIFGQTIRHVESAAVDCRENGMLAHELDYALNKDKPDGARLTNPAVRNLANDYKALTREFLSREREARQVVPA